MNHRASRQHGMTLISFIVLITIIGFDILLGLKLMPIYIEHFKIANTLENLKAEPELGDKNPKEIISMLQKRWDINSIDRKAADVLTFEKGEDGLTISLEYESEAPIMGNASALVRFKESITVGGANLSGNTEVLAKKLGLRFNDPSLFKQALTHRSADGKNNERLEFLGDSVLGFVIAECLYEKFAQADEGVLSRLRATLVNQTVLANMARQLNLGDYLILGPGELKSGGYRRDSILSDAFEAIIGAVLRDQGMEAAKRWVLHSFAEAIGQLSLDGWKKDSKTRLQELMQGRGLELPVYMLLFQEGQPHDQHFGVECRVPLMSLTTQGEGSSRKKAEQQAAERMLAKLAEEMGIDA